jgi:hypothetical protein
LSRYANRARNIRNKPTKNIDPATAQLLMLRRQLQAVQLELVHERFHGGGGAVDALHPLSYLKDEAAKEYLRVVMQKYGDVGALFLPSDGAAVAVPSGPSSPPGTPSGPMAYSAHGIPKVSWW